MITSLSNKVSVNKDKVHDESRWKEVEFLESGSKSFIYLMD